MGEHPGVPERGVLASDGDEWARAVDRAEVIGPLARARVIGTAAADQAAAEPGISRRLVYQLVARWRRGEGVVTDLLPGRSSGGRGRRRLHEDVEAVIGDAPRPGPGRSSSAAGSRGMPPTEAPAAATCRS